jgi:hypothetical protein
MKTENVTGPNHDGSYIYVTELQFMCSLSNNKNIYTKAE